MKHKISGRPRQVTKAIAYIARSSVNNQDAFIKFLKEDLKIEVKEKIAKRYVDHMGKANWDGQIIVDCIKYMYMYDVICLCSGDGDFAPLAEYLRQNGKHVEVYAFENSFSEELRSFANKVFFLRKRHLLIRKDK